MGPAPIRGGRIRTEGIMKAVLPLFVFIDACGWEIIRNDPAVAYVNSTVGVGGPNTTLNNGRMLVGLKPKWALKRRAK